MFELSGDSHGHSQVVVPHPGDVDACNRDDLIQVLEGFLRLDQQNDRIRFVCPDEKLGATRLIRVVSNSQGNASAPRRGILDLRDDLLGLLASFNAWNHDATCTDIEQSRKRAEGKIRNAGQGYDIAPAAGCNHLRH